MSTTSGSSSAAERDAGGDVMGFPDDLEVVGAGERGADAVEEQRVVVDEQDAGHRASIGRSARTTVPDAGARDRQLAADLLGALAHRCQPEAVDARLLGQAGPVVLDLQRHPGGGAVRGATTTRRAPACRIALASASAAIR